MRNKGYTQDFISAIQRRTAQVAVSASAARGQGAPGLVKAAREYLAKLPLAQFGVSRPVLFRARLDQTTRQLKDVLPEKGRNWGVARKLLNIFLRDALCTTYLSEHFRLESGKGFYELPLDSITASHLRREVPRGQLPRWLGVKHLVVEVSDQYQAAAATVANAHGIARVHLDAFWWAGPRSE